MIGIAISEATAENIPAMLALYAQPGYDDGLTLDPAAAADILKKAAHYPFYKFFVALQDGAIVGTYALLIMDNIGHCGKPSALVESVAVAPERQGGGVGRMMMDHAMDIARSRGCYKVALSSGVQRTRAHTFYEKLGFRRYGYSFGIELAEAAE